MALGQIDIFRTKTIIKRGEFHLAFALSTTLCIAKQNLSIGVNVVSKGCGCPRTLPRKACNKNLLALQSSTVSICKTRRFILI